MSGHMQSTGHLFVCSGTPPQKPSGPIITYAVFIPDSVHLVSVMEKVTETVMGRLEPYTNYTVKVRVQNSVGTKESSAVIVQTKHQVSSYICFAPGIS